MERAKIMSWLLTHAGVENENSRELIYNTLVLKIGIKELLAELSEVKESGQSNVTDELVKEYIKIELPDADKEFHYQAEGAFAVREFAKWLRSRLQPAQR